MTANAYPGNPSLAPEVKDRVLSTFSQTLALFDEGQLDEVVAGCDLILEMDQRFDPARKLRQKAKDPGAPVDLTELYSLRQSTGRAGETTAADDSDAMILSAVEAMNAGDYEAAVTLCNTVLASDPAHEEAQRIGQQANERLEAEPFVRQFLQDAETALGNGDISVARAFVEKASSLDPLHPGIAVIKARIEASDSASAPSPGASGFNFGDDSSPFASAFGAGEGAAPESTGPSDAAVPPAAEPASFDFAAPAEESPSADFGFPAEPDPSPADTSNEAAGFGFTLEEEPEPVAAPEPVEEPVSPSAEMLPGEAQTFDFATGDIDVSEDDQQKINNYISEGDELFESGDYQAAIDSWSKIFLIDVTNEQASERIEQAKEKKREADQKIDDLVTTGVAAYDRGDYSTARATFEEVLAQDADNFRAGEYLEKLDDHSAATAGGSATISPPPPPIGGDEEETLYGGDMYEEAAPPPPPAPRTQSAPKSVSAKKSPKGLLLALVAVALLAVGGWFAWSMFSGGDPEQADTSITQGKINRAQVLAEGGDYAQAITVLSSVEPGDPMREQALQLIAQYRQRQAETSGMVGGRPMNEVRDEMLTSARESFASEDFIAAKSAFEEAAKLKPLEGTDREMYEAASRQVSKLDAATALFAQGSYPEAIAELSAILEQEPENLNAREMLRNAHFNLGVNALKGRNTEGAIEQFTMVLEMDPDDEMARRSLEIAQLYEDRQKDLMYEIFVKYLPQR